MNRSILPAAEVEDHGGTLVHWPDWDDAERLRAGRPMPAASG